jgi:hypothetical protein
MRVFDYIVVGSGCAGAMAAQTLVEAGVDTVMVDVGVTRNRTSPKIPDKNYLDIRRSEPDQYKYFLGRSAEGISWGEVGKGAQVTPVRKHMTAGVDKYLPVDSDTFSPLESLGYGGLGIGWGLQCWEFSDRDLRQTGLDAARMKKAYDTVSKRIGISATKDAAAKYTLGSLKTYQPSARMDRNHSLLYKKYLAKEQYFKERGLYIGRTPLALITKDLDGRKGYRYRDMDFYSDNGESAWRPGVTIDRLRQKENFEYIGSHLVLSFREKPDYVEVICLNTQTNKTVRLKARKLLLAAGALGSARIILRSLGKPGTKLPLLCNPHSYVPCLQPAMMGKGTEAEKLGLGQLSLFIDKDGKDSGLSVASTYSYQSLMLFRLINQIPLSFRDARPLLQYIMPGLIIMIVQHPDHVSADKFLSLAPSADSITGDKMVASYIQSHEEISMGKQRVKEYARSLKKLRVYALKKVDVEHGASIHYAGTVPFSKKPADLSLSPQGRLHGSQRVYVADSSGFNYLPAKGLTFSLMANAHITAENALKNA